MTDTIELRPATGALEPEVKLHALANPEWVRGLIVARMPALRTGSGRDQPDGPGRVEDQLKEVLAVLRRIEENARR